MPGGQRWGIKTPWAELHLHRKCRCLERALDNCTCPLLKLHWRLDAFFSSAQFAFAKLETVREIKIDFPRTIWRSKPAISRRRAGGHYQNKLCLSCHSLNSVLRIYANHLCSPLPTFASLQQRIYTADKIHNQQRVFLMALILIQQCQHQAKP